MHVDLGTRHIPIPHSTSKKTLVCELAMHASLSDKMIRTSVDALHVWASLSVAGYFVARQLSDSKSTPRQR